MNLYLDLEAGGTINLWKGCFDKNKFIFWMSRDETITKESANSTMRKKRIIFKIIFISQTRD